VTPYFTSQAWSTVSNHLKLLTRVQQIRATDRACKESALRGSGDGTAVVQIYANAPLKFNVNVKTAFQLAFIVETKEDDAAADWKIAWSALGRRGIFQLHPSCTHLPFAGVTRFPPYAGEIELVLSASHSGRHSTLSSEDFISVRRFFIITTCLPPIGGWRLRGRSKHESVRSVIAPRVLQPVLDKYFDGISYLKRYEDARKDVLAGRKPSALRHWMDTGVVTGRKAELADLTSPCHGTVAQWLATENEKLLGAIAIKNEEITLLREQIVDQSKSLEMSATQLARAKRHLQQIESSIGTGHEPA
jgi:hypothetical protein